MRSAPGPGRQLRRISLLRRNYEFDNLRKRANVTTYDKPLPRVDKLNRPFWDGLRAHRICTQRCLSCGRRSHPPVPVCAACHGVKFEWVEIAGGGTIWSFVIFHQIYAPAFAADKPYNVLIVELTEGIRLYSSSPKTDQPYLSVGAAVTPIFTKITNDITLLTYRLVDALEAKEARSSGS
jgi:uncharacterized OB-fold protein